MALQCQDHEYDVKSNLQKFDLDVQNKMNLSHWEDTEMRW